MPYAKAGAAKKLMNKGKANKSANHKRPQKTKTKKK
jgi:hypothetical protein